MSNYLLLEYLDDKKEFAIYLIKRNATTLEMIIITYLVENHCIFDQILFYNV